MKFCYFIRQKSRNNTHTLSWKSRTLISADRIHILYKIL